MNKKTDFKLIWIFLLAFFYAVNDAFNSAGTGNSNTERSSVYIFLIALVGSMAFFVVLRRYIYTNNLVTSMFLFTVYFIVDFYLIKQTGSWSNFVQIGLSTWWIFTLLYIGNTLTSDPSSFYTIRNFTRLMFVFYAFVIIYGSLNIAKNTAVDFARVGYIYHIMALLPILLLEQSKGLKAWYMVITIFLTIFSFKRGAILLLPIMIFAYYIAENKVGLSKHNISRLVLIFIALIIVFFAIDGYTDGALSSRFTSEELADGSGRADIYSTLLNNISMRGPVQLLFGIRTTGETIITIGAHNEWLGRLDQLGIFGLVFFLAIFWYMIKPAFRLLKANSPLAPSYIAMAVFVTGISMVSGLYFVHSSFYLMVYIAMINVLSSMDDKQLMHLLTSNRKTLTQPK